MNNTIVSFENENLILVDDSDNILGYKSKAECHDGQGILHRAFSVFIFNQNNELLLQQRAKDKRLWPLIWSNSCCSHPREGESYEFATQRRLHEELGIKTNLHYLYKFKYHAHYKNIGSEFELCSVYIGKTADTPQTNDTEIASWKFVTQKQMNKDLAANPDIYSPWFKMEWQEIQTKYWQNVLNI